MSKTQIQTQTRRYDHIYDPIYSVSGSRDHARLNAQAARAQVERVPDRANYFSEIPSVYRSHCFKTKTVTELPAHISTEHRGNELNVATKRVVTEADVSGPNRHKHFRRPIIPLLHSSAPEVLLGPRKTAPTKSMLDENNATFEEEQDGPRHQSTQTLLRDSEAQTTPYSPDYIIPEGTNPEILTLAGLQFGNGLPITMREVEIIERARQKRKLLQSLPPITDEASFNLRKRMMEEQELLELEQKEADIQKVHCEHLKLLRQALQARKEESDFIAEQRIAAFHQQKMESKDKQIAEIQHCRIKAMRKLAKARRKAEFTPIRKDIVGEYSTYSSETYAPLLREGRITDKDSTREFDFRSKLNVLKSSKGLQYLEKGIPKQVTKVHIKRPRKQKPHTVVERKRANLAMHLEKMDTLLRSRKHEQHCKGDFVKTRNNNIDESADIESPSSTSTMDSDHFPKWRKRVEKMTRPPTPGFSDDEESDDNENGPQDANSDLYNALTLLQKLLRGRAIQNMMFEGKEKRLELIRELRNVPEHNPVYDYSLRSYDSEALPSSAEENRKAPALLDENRKAAALDAIQGEVISNSLDFFANELVRIQQEARVSGYALASIEERRQREMVEAGRRQAEQNKRNREEQMFQQLMHVHQGTVESYYDEILADSIEEASLIQAAHDINVNITPRSCELQQTDEETVQELVTSFLMPHVNREHTQSQIQFEGRRFVHAAHGAILDMMNDIEENGHPGSYESKYEN